MAAPQMSLQAYIKHGLKVGLRIADKQARVVQEACLRTDI